MLLLTGKPGIGKTTVICQAAAQLQQYGIRGFYTQEIREAGQRRGFRLVTFNGEQGIIAHVTFDHHFRVGKYGVDVGCIDYFADTAVRVANDVDLYLIDEIGKMECLSHQFVHRVRQLLVSDKPLIATVGLTHGLKGGGLMEEVKRWPGIELWEITHANRDNLPAHIVEWVQNHVPMRIGN